MVVKIKDIPKEDRPCERLIEYGAETLSNEELLAIIFKTGTKGNSAKDLGNELLSKIESIKKLNDINLEFLRNFKGIGVSKACNLLAAIELGKRINREVDSLKNVKLTSSNIVYKYYKDKIGNKKQECFYAVYLDNGKKIIGDKLLFMGTVNYSLVHPREIFKEAYLLGASAIICVHNHPGGNPLPSKQDLEITNNLIEASKILGIKLLDHIIICKNNYYSFLENNDICF
ncbi:MAG: DNA repair protein RadC [Bacilli bacterium]|nr:DNA repair protein RadC [Bacilli bacterium]